MRNATAVDTYRQSLSIRTALSLPYRAAMAWVDHRCVSAAAALAYYAAFSLAPILVIAVSISGVVFGRAAVEGRILAELSGLVGSDGASLVQKMIRASYFEPNSGKAAVIGIVGMLIGATGLFMELSSTFERIFQSARTYRNAFVALLMERLRGLVVVVGVGFLLIVSLVASAAIVSASEYLTAGLSGWGGVVALLQTALSLTFISALFALMFRLLVPIRLPRLTLLCGAIVTAVLFELGKWVIGFYLGSGAVGSVVGASGTLAALLVWIYYVSMIVLYGAEFTCQLHHATSVTSDVPAHVASKPVLTSQA